MAVETVGELIDRLDDYGNHIRIVFVTDDGTQYNISSIEPVTIGADGSAGVGLYID